MSATKKIVVCAILTALGIVLGYIENLFPQIIPLYGLKIGFSNLVVIYALYEFSIKYAISIGVAKSVLSGITFSGLLHIMYGGFGIILSVISMYLIKKSKLKCSEIGVSVSGSAAFQVGQVAVACVVLKTYAPLNYLSYLLIGSVACGIISGFLVRILRRNK